MEKELEENFDAPKSKLKRIDKYYIAHEIQHLLHFDRGIFFTLKNLLLKPGKSIREFLFENRDNYVKPLLFLIITSVIFTLVTHLLHLKLSFFNIDTFEPVKGKIRSKEIGEWTNTNIGYAQLIMGVFIALWIKVFFRKFKYNIYEILVLLSYVLGEALFIFGCFIIVANVFNSEIIATIGIITYFIYIIWAIGQFFGERRLINYIKSIFVYVLGNASYLVVLILLAYLLKFI